MRICDWWVYNIFMNKIKKKKIDKNLTQNVARRGCGERKKSSALARGPRNPKDKRYDANERQIHRVINRALAKRRINLRATEICRDARISSPTFYLHCRGSDDALKGYEKRLVLEFREALVTEKPRREVIFVVLLKFVAQNQGYFMAMVERHDAWLLAQILDSVRVELIGNKISDKCFDIYVGKLKALIFCWGKYERFNKQKIPLYTQKLMQTRVMDLGI